MNKGNEPIISDRAAWIMGRLLKYLVVLGVIVFVAGWIQGLLRTGSGERPYRINCAGNLKQIGLALIIYAGDDPDNGYFPDGTTFEALHIGQYLENGRVYGCPEVEGWREATSGMSSYLYVGAGVQDIVADPELVVLAHDKVGNHSNWANFLFADGRVKGARVDDGDIDAAIRRNGWRVGGSLQ